VQFVIAGVAKNLQDLLGYSPSIRRNVVGIPVSQMSDLEVAELITMGEQHAGLPFEPDARREIVELARGRPYLARLICHHASLTAVNAQRDAVSEVDVGSAIERAVNEIGSRLPDHAKHSATAWLVAHPEEILALARASLLDSGDFAESDVHGAGDADLAEKASGLIEQLSASGDLLSTPDGPDLRRYRFAEDGLPSFLLLAAARSKGHGADDHPRDD
jgi:hypothetical protein